MAKQSSIETFRQLFRELNKPEKLKPVYYLYGEESFFIDLIQEEAEKLVPEDQKDFNFDLIYASESSPEKVLGIVKSYPMMAEKRVVIVRDFLKLEKSSQDGSLQDFIGYFSQPNPTAHLFLLDSKFPDKRTSLGKSLSSKGGSISVHEFSTLHENRIPEWIIDWTRHAHKKEMDPAAAHILGQLVGQDLKLLSTEIEKVCTFVDSQESINQEHVKKITGSYRDFSVFELKDAVIKRDLELSLRISEQMLQRGNYTAGDLFQTVGFFYSVFCNIWQICRLTEKGLNKKQVQDQLGIRNSYIFNAQWHEASHFKLAEMPVVFEALLDADRAAKGFSTLDIPTILLLLVKRIIG